MGAVTTFNIVFAYMFIILMGSLASIPITTSDITNITINETEFIELSEEEPGILDSLWQVIKFALLMLGYFLELVVIGFNLPFDNNTNFLINFLLLAPLRFALIYEGASYVRGTNND